MRAVDDKCDRQRARIAVELCLPIRCWWSCLVWRRRRPPSCEHAGVRAVSTTLLAAVTCSAREKRASTLHRIGPPCSSHSRVRMSVVCVRRERVGSVVTIARGGDSGLEPAAGSHACSFTRTAASGACGVRPFRESCRLWPGLLFVKDYAKTDSKTTTEIGTAAHDLLLGGGVPIVVVVR